MEEVKQERREDVEKRDVYGSVTFLVVIFVI